ncbi:helix-turn-helix domain-containing protein [Sphingomonas rubra]|uniref:AraC family transcriptional regulator, transcriptional activator of the genes for pyochelin and ferripyochelin receptors n=1 Tax=Sphingomonas rubra TaxID=634430 RepID=A0A1I5QM30_9SPHN|nr:helix-turn-helix transcriptional regulator [Sphingomonas rubra]SFP47313.1 AraC family transcriptional regulator, transcriptional activator of the genes for pyochelin and ferripyochelin receptors [Sphingomonas rubra]
MTSKQRIDVSPEMLSFVGPGPIVCDDAPADTVNLRFDLDAGAPTLGLGGTLADATDATIVLAVKADACRRIFGFVPASPGCWHLPADLAHLAVAIRDCPLPGPACATLRLAKSIELLCATFETLARETLISADRAGALSERDAARLAAARRLVDERWQEKLTLDGIARACGLNRAKLTRGFRQAFGSTVADAIAQRRLQGAHSLLLATDLPVSSIGYQCGYSNNASFTRAFSRRYGVAPTRLRAGGAAA